MPGDAYCWALGIRTARSHVCPHRRGANSEVDRADACNTGAPALPKKGNEFSMNFRPAPAVSIIMPAFNADRFIAETVASARAQTFSDFELLIVDDGSTDSTLTLARELQARD